MDNKCIATGLHSLQAIYSCRLALWLSWVIILMSVAAPISAAQAIGEFLQSPDDLLKIMTFRKKLEKEKGSIDARLKSGVKEQLDATREGLRKLLRTRNNVQVIKDEMETVETECSDPRNVVTTFDQISRVSVQMHWRNYQS